MGFLIFVGLTVMSLMDDTELGNFSRPLMMKMNHHNVSDNVFTPVSSFLLLFFFFILVGT